MCYPTHLLHHLPHYPYLSETSKLIRLLNAHFSICQLPHKCSSIKMSDHKQLTISNVEFCMMNFYKLQWESQQRRTKRALNCIEKNNKTIKRQKRELDHRDAAIRVLNLTVQARDQDLDTLQANCTALFNSNMNLVEREYRAQRAERLTDTHNTRILFMMGQIFDENPAIQQKFEPLIRQELARYHEEMGMPILHSNEQVNDADYDSDATIPTDESIYFG